MRYAIHKVYHTTTSIVFSELLKSHIVFYPGFRRHHTSPKVREKASYWSMHRRNILKKTSFLQEVDFSIIFYSALLHLIITKTNPLSKEGNTQNCIHFIGFGLRLHIVVITLVSNIYIK